VLFAQSYTDSSLCETQSRYPSARAVGQSLVVCFVGCPSKFESSAGCHVQCLLQRALYLLLRRSRCEFSKSTSRCRRDWSWWPVPVEWLHQNEGLKTSSKRSKRLLWLGRRASSGKYSSRKSQPWRMNSCTPRGGEGVVVPRG